MTTVAEGTMQNATHRRHDWTNPEWYSGIYRFSLYDDAFPTAGGTFWSGGVEGIRGWLAIMSGDWLRRGEIGVLWLHRFL